MLDLAKGTAHRLRIEVALLLFNYISMSNIFYFLRFKIPYSLVYRCCTYIRK